MAFNPNQVVLDGFTQHDFAFTMFLKAGHGLTDDELIGRAVTLDTTADATYGRIFQVEDRSQEGVVTVTVETRFRKRLKKASATTMARGDTAVGAGDGLVKSAAAADAAKNVVLSVADEYVIVEQ